MSAVPERSPLPRSSPLPPIDIDAVIDAILTGRVYSADDLFLMRRHIASFTKAPEDGGNILTIRKPTDPDTVIVTLATHTPETVAAFFEEVFPGYDPERLPVTVKRETIGELLEQTEFSYEDLLEIQNYIAGYFFCHERFSEVTPNILQIGVIGSAPSAEKVGVGLWIHTPETVSAFFEEFFPGIDPETIPVEVYEMEGFPYSLPDLNGM